MAVQIRCCETIAVMVHQEEGMKKRESASHPGVLLIGNFFTGGSGTHGVGQDLAVALKTAGWSVVTASSRPGRVARLLDFLVTVWRCRDGQECSYKGRTRI